MYSQNDEEKHIIEIFGEAPSGKFLDIGAYDGKTFSNVRRLWELGWTGVLVEPNPKSFHHLMKNFPPDEGAEVELVNAAIAMDDGLIEFHSSNDAVSTMSESHRELWSKAVKFRKIHVCAITVESLLEKFPGPYRFVNLDVEGMNFEILTQLPLEDLQCECICVEFENHSSDILLFMAEEGWKMVAKNSENFIFTR
jgi:FkbM family methyltransferase